MADTPVWSAALRRSEGATNPYRTELLKLVDSGLVEIIGPIRQEILSGIKDLAKFELVREHLRNFPDLEINTADYEEAASFYNRCRSAGVQGAFTDFVICAVAFRHELSIFTDDRDFHSYRKILPIRLHSFEMRR